MKCIIKAFVASVVFTLLLFPAGSEVIAAQFQHGAQRVMGIWQCLSINGNRVNLVIDQENFALNGDGTPYTMVTGAIRVEGAYGPVNYYYNFRGDSLLVAFPDGERIICERAQQQAQNHKGQPEDLPAQAAPDDANTGR